MKVEIDEHFLKDIRSLQNKTLNKKIARIIENVATVSSINEITAIKKLKGYDRHYRIRVGDYRVGMLFSNNIVIFVRFLHRKDIYKYFP